jgi:putative ABC transport system permease protein
MLAVDHDFIGTFGMELAQGRAFDPSYSTDTETYIINEEAARQLNWDEPLTKTIAMPVIDRPRAVVVGVLKDFHFRSMHEEIGPILFFVPPVNWFSIVTVRFRPEQAEAVLAYLETQWKIYDPGHPFTYNFFDQQYGRLHQAEQQMAQLINRFAFIAILIACLGLFGLAVFTAQQRTKEIGIRKVLGASIPGIIGLLSRDFTQLVLVAFIVACPFGYLLTDNWLQSFAYKADIGIGMYVLAGGLALLIAWITVGYQAVKAALSNPVDALRYE